MKRLAPRIARVRKRIPAPPTAAALERERALWGPNPDRELGRIEEAFYLAGFRFLAHLYAAAFGVQPPRQLLKAFPGMKGHVPVPDHDWGALVRSFNAPGGDPLAMRDEWTRLIDRLVGKFFPQRTQAEIADAMAIRAHWLGRVRTRTEELAGQPPPNHWNEAVGRMAENEVQAMAWTKARALEGCSGLANGAKEALLKTLIQSREAGEGPHQLTRRCFDAFADQNRDWRRLALTESAAAHANGQLAAATRPGEEWVAEWMTARGGCPWCEQWRGRTFRLVSRDQAVDGQTEVWTGKTNIGRSGAAKTRDGRVRGPADLWWPCIPCHPHCACQYQLKRIK